ncbi:acyloxyacyl hydrolase [uncultured Algibacter sp.]|uniref:acyloxyacyl hydrolase n=1 Tax=uncultured Algibacter sp. TaxID=298659 RepID=UPI002609D88A|nr:acyloxyacyl hydrolase [uncultured Algibacter sp.]
MNLIFRYTLCIFCVLKVNAQEGLSSKSDLFYNAEVYIGQTLEANTGFPETNLQTGAVFSMGSLNRNNSAAWVKQLGRPKSGFSLSFTDFGNSSKLGRAYSFLPYLEFGLFKKKTNKLNLAIGVGGAYIDTQFSNETNPYNRAISTTFNWAFRSVLYYNILERSKMDWRLGLGYFHHSNGHTRLPNQGLNSLIFNVSAMIPSQKEAKHPLSTKEKNHKERSKQTYINIQTGIGQNVLSELDITKREVYTITASAGIVLNRTFKFGGGMYYRFLEGYYDYIKSDGELISEQVPHFKETPYKYATNFGFFGSAELLLSHVGFEWNIGFNVYKPFYKIDYQINQGYSYYDGEKTIFFLGELDWYYEVKRTISSKLGLKYYVFNTNDSPKNNIFMGIYINSNLGQADFTELSLGYVYRFKLKNRKE